VTDTRRPIGNAGHEKHAKIPAQTALPDKRLASRNRAASEPQVELADQTPKNKLADPS
jgi:hypothetical protein